MPPSLASVKHLAAVDGFLHVQVVIQFCSKYGVWIGSGGESEEGFVFVVLGLHLSSQKRGELVCVLGGKFFFC